MSLNEEKYLSSYLPVYRRMGVEPSLLLQFPVLLPFHIPFKPGLTVTFWLDGGDACTLNFTALTTTQGVYAGVVSNKPVDVPMHRSRVEMTYVFGTPKAAMNTESEVSQTFDLLVHRLNSLIAAYAVVTKDHRVYRVSREMFEFGSIWRVIHPNDWQNQGVGLFLLHMEVPFAKPEMDDATQKRVVWFANVLEREWNPFILSEELSLSARRAFLNGSYREAIVFAQTSVETFLSTLLATMLREEGLTDSEIDRMLEDVPFLSRVRREYHKRLGGQWTIEGKGAVNAWYAHTYVLRNHIIHAGYQPTFDETAKALDGARDLVRYALSLSRTAAKRFPELQRFLVTVAEQANSR
jgi:hypothetical protein